MPTLTTILAFGAASIALLLIPGPAVLYILNRSISDGRTVGLAAVGGLELGNLVHALAAAAGLSAVLATSAAAFNTVKWLGVAYLLFVGIRTLLRPPLAIAADQPGMSTRRAFGQGVIVNILNPKVALFFLSFLPQFIHTSDGRLGTQALVLGLVFVGCGCVTDTLYSILASSLRGVLLRGRTLPFVRRYVAGAMFIGLGLVAATATATATHPSSSTK
ncbi:MAG: RhtB family transporter [Ilumatobacteraceae bacterium]|nr:RhtB family transporter [Ilumatobacteraceae bacterium]